MSRQAPAGFRTLLCTSIQNKKPCLLAVEFLSICFPVSALNQGNSPSTKALWFPRHFSFLFSFITSLSSCGRLTSTGIVIRFQNCVSTRSLGRISFFLPNEYFLITFKSPLVSRPITLHYASTLLRQLHRLQSLTAITFPEQHRRAQNGV